jgi:hypothetical protein
MNIEDFVHLTLDQFASMPTDVFLTLPLIAEDGTSVFEVVAAQLFSPGAIAIVAAQPILATEVHI